MPTQPTALVALLEDLRAEHDDLDHLVAPLDEAGWNTATPAEGWAVRDQISHLAFFDDAAALAITDPDRFQVTADAALKLEGDPMEEHLQRGRSMSGRKVLEWWRSARRDMGEAAGTLSPKARVPWFGPPMSAMSFVSARLMETWAHGQDVIDALGVGRVPTARLRHVAHLGVRARAFSYLVRGMDAPVAPIGVRLTAPSGEEWAWDTDADPPDRVLGPALDFCLVVTQRRNIADTDLQVDGDGAKEWLSIAQAFAGPPGPGRPPSAGPE